MYFKATYSLQKDSTKNTKIISPIKQLVVKQYLSLHMKEHFIQALKQRIATPKKIVIIPHRNPDGDALGSTLALKHFLNQMHHNAQIVSPNDYPSFLTISVRSSMRSKALKSSVKINSALRI